MNNREALNTDQKVFLTLLRAGLFSFHGEGLKVNESLFCAVEWKRVYRLAQEQSVQGIVLQGLEKLRAKNLELRVPQTLLLQWIGEVQMIEQRNKAMNLFIAELFERLRKNGIFALLMKGQGVAQCYDKPLWRVSGDVDLLLSEDNYRKAAQVLSHVASSIDEENMYNKHIAMTINGWSVELHGTLRSGLWQNLDCELDNVQNVVFYESKVRTWMNGATQVFLPNADEDVVFVFAHILQHFYKEGIGLRQICDWCRLLWTYKDSLNHKLLESRIRKMGLITEWKTFAALSVDYLGMPVEAMPFYSEDKKWKRKAVRVLEFVLETGNFGHNRDYSYYKKYPYIVYKAISFWKHLKDGAFFFSIYPLDSIKVTWRRMAVGVSVVLQGKKHE